MPDRPTPNQAALLNALATPGARLSNPRGLVFEVRLPGVPNPVHVTTKQCARACLKRRWITAFGPGNGFRLTSEGILARGRM